MKKVLITFGVLLAVLAIFFSGVVASSNLRKVNDVYVNDNFKILINGKLYIPRESDGAIIQSVIRNNKPLVPLALLNDLLNREGVSISYNNNGTVSIADPDFSKTKDDFAVDSIPTIALSVAYNSVKDYVHVKIDKAKLPGGMRQVAYISLIKIQMPNLSTSEMLSTLQQEMSSGHQYLEKYDNRGYSSSGNLPMVLGIYNIDKKLLGIKVINKEDGYTKTINLDNLKEITSGIVFKNVTSKGLAYINISIDKAKLPSNISDIKFIKISDRSTPTKEMALDELSYELTNNELTALIPFVKSNGLTVNAKKPAIIYLFDANKKPVAYMLWK